MVVSLFRACFGWRVTSRWGGDWNESRSHRRHRRGLHPRRPRTWTAHAGIAGTVAYGVARDDDGFFRTDEIHVATPTSAITSDSLDLGGTPGDADWVTERGDFATVTLDLRPAGSGEELFAGIGPTDDVTRYLASVAHDRVSD